MYACETSRGELPLVQLPNMKVEALSDLNDSPLLLACRSENHLALAKDWKKLLGDYPMLCDLWSDVIQAKGQLLKRIAELDRQGEIAEAIPAPISRFSRYLILFSPKYFSKAVEVREAVVIHELGHFYVYRKALLKQLSKSRVSSEPAFMQFIAPVQTRYQKLLLDYQKDWLKNTLFAINVLDVLKIPGEIFSNLWVKDNFEEMFSQVVETQFEEYRNASRGKEKVAGTFCYRALIKFMMFSLILRLDGLLILVDNSRGRLQKAKQEIQEFHKSCWKTLEDCAYDGELGAFAHFEKEIIDASCSLDGSNNHLPGIFEEFVKNLQLRKEDISGG